MREEIYTDKATGKPMVTKVPDGWRAVPGIGTRVKADHPQTCFNPDETFLVAEIKHENGGVYVRGEDTCWFALSTVTPVPQQ
ncbi:hypothetical protein RHDC4_01619 [Rhodocyclaceae bacterium]|nr:hypothetical protein RHDC4_01619 [Rhodocyclaceae bacterium]